MKYILLSGVRGKGKRALVDDEDFESLSKWSWNLDELGYARRTTSKRYNGVRKFKCIFMHRQVNNTPVGLFTDHINHNTLDNRKSNLRTATKQQNHANREFTVNSTGYRGVIASRNNGSPLKFHAQIKDNKKNIYLGAFKTSKEAAAAYNMAASTIYGEFATLNKI